MEQGLVLTGVGMGVVVLFLTLMVLAVYATAAIFRRVGRAAPGANAADGKAK